MLETSLGDTWVYCDAISATVLATCVTWRSALIASVIWMLPKYMTSIRGSRIANSMAEVPRRSAKKRRGHSEARWRGVIMSTA
jgi:hypothetical protein